MLSIGFAEIVVLLLVLVPLVLLIAGLVYALVLLVKVLRKANRRLDETQSPGKASPGMR